MRMLTGFFVMAFLLAMPFQLSAQEKEMARISRLLDEFPDWQGETDNVRRQRVLMEQISARLEEGGDAS